MFDVGFLELFLIMVIALMVIGPKRMPEVARKVGIWIGKSKHFINNMKENSELSSAIKEMKDSLNMEEEKQQIEKMRNTIQDDISDFQQEVNTDEEISRPSFSSQEKGDKNIIGSSQFNKAPTTPTLPAKEESVAEKPTQHKSEKKNT